MYIEKTNKQNRRSKEKKRKRESERQRQKSNIREVVGSAASAARQNLLSSLRKPVTIHLVGHTWSSFTAQLAVLLYRCICFPLLFAAKQLPKRLRHPATTSTHYVYVRCSQPPATPATPAPPTTSSSECRSCALAHSRSRSRSALWRRAMRNNGRQLRSLTNTCNRSHANEATLFVF